MDDFEFGFRSDVEIRGNWAQIKTEKSATILSRILSIEYTSLIFFCGVFAGPSLALGCRAAAVRSCRMIKLSQVH